MNGLSQINNTQTQSAKQNSPLRGCLREWLIDDKHAAHDAFVGVRNCTLHVFLDRDAAAVSQLQVGHLFDKGRERKMGRVRSHVVRLKARCVLR